MKPKHAAWLVSGCLLVAVAAIALVPDDAWARVGGGQTFRSGRSSGGGSSRSWSSSSGGGGGDGAALFDLTILLIRLCIEYPAIGVPLVLLLVAFLIARVLFDRPTASAPREVRHSSDAQARRAAVRAALTEGFRAHDAGFSMPAFQEHAMLVARRAMEAAGSGRFEPLAPYLSDTAAKSVRERLPEGGTDVVFASIEADGPAVMEERAWVVVRLTGSMTRGARHVYFEDELRLSRPLGITSPAPEALLRLGCPSCGSALEADALGACKSCGTPVTKGQLSWQVVGWERRVERQLEGLGNQPGPGGREPGYASPTVRQLDFGAALRRLRARAPDFDEAAFLGRVGAIFVALQSAWSEGRWEGARPYTTDALFNQLSFWMDRYAREGLRNQLDAVRLERAEIVKVDHDAWYEAVTVRIWGSMCDSVVDRAGRVVGGNATVPREFSEYWTFLRSVGAGGASRPEVSACPSCGAPLDRISQAGVCGYCESRITSGRFDWVLSRIEQAEVYQG